jgi:hypothetical protein
MTTPAAKPKKPNSVNPTSVKQALRVRAGRWASTPSDYYQPGEMERRLTAARHALEDRAIERGLGVDPDPYGLARSK